MSTKTDKGFFGHPSGLASLFATEMWERFSYYGMRALLVLYLTATFAQGGFGLDDNAALAIYGIFTGLVYLTPIIGGMLADKILGQRKAIYIGAFTMAIGQLVLAASTMVSPLGNEPTAIKETLLYSGLGLLILGNGFFKPNISTMVGEMYDNNDPRKDGGFTIFYMGINLGAFLSPVIAGTLGEVDKAEIPAVAGHIGNLTLYDIPYWGYGFLVAGIGMIIGTVWFFLRSHTLDQIGLPPKYKGEKTRILMRDWGHVVLYTLAMVAIVVGFILGWSSLPKLVEKIIIGVVLVFGVVYLLFIIVKNTEGGAEWSRVGVIMVLCLGNIFFWSGFEQAGGTFNIFARDSVNRVLQTSQIEWFTLILGIALLAYWGYLKFAKNKNNKACLISGLLVVAVYFILPVWVFTEPTLTIKASLFQSINAMAIFVFAPVFTVMWMKLDKIKRNPSTPLKFGIGMLLLSIGFFVIALVNERALKGVLVAPFWLVLVYLLHTWGELSLSPIGLSMVTKLSPPKIVSTMMGIWFASTALGNYLAASMKKIVEAFDLPLFWFIAVETLIAAIVLIIISPWLKKMMRGIK